MRRQIASFAFMICGVIALVGGFTMLSVPASVSAEVSGPSTRPPLNTATPDRSNKPTEVVPGRLTGTIIDLRTGAPAPNVAVVIGDQTIYSDSNGNYDIWLTSGYYDVTLKPTAAQGESIQPLQRIAVGPGDTVVVHLFFKSPAPTVVAQEVVPTVATVVPTATVIVPTPTHAPHVALPPVLPDTSVSHTAAAAHPLDRATAPQSLPNTAAPAGGGTPVAWLIFGTVMLSLGALITLTPSRRRALSAAQRKAARKRASNDEALLSDLLNRDL